MFYNIGPWSQCYKTFTDISYDFSLYARAFVLGNPFQPSLTFVGKAGANPNEANVLHYKVGTRPYPQTVD